MRKYTLIEVVLPLVVISTFILLLFAPSLTYDFSKKDEPAYKLIAASDARVHPQLVGSVGNYNSLWATSVTGEFEVGRFRPFYWVIVHVEALMFGGNILWLRVETLLIAIITLYLFFRSARLLNIPLLIALVLSFSLVVGSDGKIWWETMIAEEPAMLLTAVSVYAIIKGARQGVAPRWDALALLTMTLAGFIKETFVVIMPALVLFRLVLSFYWQSNWNIKALIRHLAPFVIVSAVICVAQLVGVLTVYRIGGYGATIAGDLEESVTAATTWFDLLAAPAQKLAFFIPALGILFWLPVGLRKGLRGRLLLVGGVFVLVGWLLPQLVIYSSSGGFHKHYVYPTLIALATLNTLGLAVLWQQRRWWAFIPMIVLVLLTGIPQMSQISRNGSEYAGEAVALNLLMTQISEDLRPEDEIVMAMKASPGYLAYPRIWLGLQNRENIVHTHFVQLKDSEADRIIRYSQPGNSGGIVYDEETFDPSRTRYVGVIVDAQHLDEALPEWFDPSQWEVQVIEVPIVELTFTGYQPVDHHRLQLFIRR